MALQIDTVTSTCDAIAQQVRDSHKNLVIRYIIHREGRRAEALAKAADTLGDHPAAGAAHRLLTEAGGEEQALAGVAVARENLFLGLAVRDSLLALAPINIDRFNSMKDIRAQAWHLAWHALDALAWHNDPSSHAGGLRHDTVARRLSDAERGAANLRADVFAAVMAGFQGSGDAVQRLARLRSLEVLQPRHGHRPEDYPFSVAAESVTLLLNKIKGKSFAKKKWMYEAHAAARQIGKSFDAEAVEDWLSLGESAQDMAWRGYNGEQIIGAAMNTSDVTQIRAYAHIITEQTEIKPASVFDLNTDYSPFASDDYNERLHERTVDRIFEEVMREARRQRGPDPLTDTANSQNLKLLSGHLLGWCAGTLQSAALAWAGAKQAGLEPHDAALRAFEVGRSRTSWSTLRELSRRIVAAYREDKPVTMSAVLEMTKDDRAAEALVKSIEETMKQQGPAGGVEPTVHVNLTANRPKTARPRTPPAKKAAS